jgi:hypothetical protein
VRDSGPLPEEQQKTIDEMQAKWAADPAYPKTEATAASVGRFIQNYNTLEDSVMRVAWFLIDPENERAAQVILDGQDAARVEDLLRALLPLRVSAGPFLDYGLGLIDKLSELRIFRRSIVHGISRFQTFGDVPPNVELLFRPKRSAADYRVVGDALDKDANDEGTVLAVSLDLILTNYLRELVRLYALAYPEKEEVVKKRLPDSASAVYALGLGKSSSRKD